MKLLAGLSFVAVLLLTGCRVGVDSIRSGYRAPSWVGPQDPAAKPLTETQVKGLSLWFADHQDGWRHEISDAPIGKFVCLTLKNGKAVWVNVVGSRIWVGSRYRTLSASDRATFDMLLY